MHRVTSNISLNLFGEYDNFYRKEKLKKLTWHKELKAENEKD